ncbi:MAG: flippase-like domain-containing protein, partial [Chloroflexi bacterium]|nr:flippase-like domain-containing protein [Chloroflexota bacterium]
MDSEKKDQRQLWIGIGISVASLAILFIFIKPTDIIDAFRQANLFYLGIASFTIVIFLFLQGVRWRFLLNNEISFRELFHIQNIGYMLNMYLPARLGDFTRAVLVGSVPPVTIATGLSTMLVGRIIDMMFMVAILPFSLVAVPTLPEQLRAAALGTGVLALVAIIILILAANMRPLAGRIATAVFNRISFMDTQTWVRRIDDLLKGLDSLTRLKDG